MEHSAEQSVPGLLSSWLTGPAPPELLESAALAPFNLDSQVIFRCLPKQVSMETMVFTPSGSLCNLGASQVALVVKKTHANAGGVRAASLIPGSRRPPGEGRGNLPQHPWLENPMDRGAWWARVHQVAKSLMRLS